MEPHDEMRQFFTCLFGDKHPLDHILIWVVPSKISRFFTIIEDAIEYCMTARESHNVYFGVGLQDTPKLKGRGELKDISGLTSLWLDLDIADDVHSKKNLPSSVDEVLEIMDQVPWPPTMTIHSGHGLQMYWKLRETYEINTDEDRNKASLLVKRLQRFVRSLFIARGYTIDSTHNLDRVMRVGGTLNAKKDPAIPVRILDINSHITYNPSDFDDLPEIEEEALNLPSVSINANGLILDPQANPPIDKFQALMEADIKFAQSWEHKRRDFPSGDTSQSSYDLSLATLAAMAGWEDQEIINLIQSNRRKWRADPKLRLDYYTDEKYGVLVQARRTVLKNQAHREIEAEAANLNARVSSESKEMTQEEREALWEKYSNIWGFKIYRVVRTLGDPNVFHMEVAGGRVEFGSSLSIINQNTFRYMVSDRTLVLIPKEKPAAWENIARLFIASAETLNLGDEASNLGMITGWVCGYLDSRPPCSPENDRYYQEIDSGQPFIKDGNIYITMSEIRTWIIATQRENIRMARLQSLLNQMGCTYESIHFQKQTKHGAKDSTKKVWLVPKSSITQPSQTPFIQPTQLMIEEDKSMDGDYLPEIDF